MTELDNALPRLELDPLALRQQQQRLLFDLFGIETKTSLLKHYELLHELGRGSMGVVYVAHDRRLGRKVAIKKLALEGDPELRSRLVAEARAMAQLAHPNVVPVYEIGEVGDSTFIVMAYVEGVVLRTWLELEHRDLDALLTVFMAAGQGLAAAHAKGIVHRDFKPDNVMVGDDQRVRVMDFGVAHWRASPEALTQTGLEQSERLGDPASDPASGLAATQPSTSLTQTGALVGTPAYMAPEQLRGDRADEASDQFAFCIVLYEALYGQRPFAGETLQQLRAQVERGQLQTPPDPLSVPAWLHAIVVRGLASEPEARFESMQTLLDALAAGEGSRAPLEYVFVAHHGADTLACLRVCEQLLTHGIRTWLGAWEPTDQAARLEALARAPAVLICHGPGGWPSNQTFEHDPSTLWQLELPHASPELRPTQWPALLTPPHRGDSDETIASLACSLGPISQRKAWLGDEAERAGLDPATLSPYRGLESFRERDARWMFGRELETGELLERLHANTSRFSCVVGASGSGKSSLIMAGLCPALRSGVWGEDIDWEISTLRPGPRPCESLARAIAALDPNTQPKPLRRSLLDDTRTLGEFVRRRVAAAATQAPNRRLCVLLVVDQLEELFTEAGLGRGARPPEALAFLDNLIKATRNDTGLWVVSTLRADFVHRCLEFRGLARMLHAGTYLALPPMAKPQLRAAIEQPARRVGYEVEPELVAELVNAAAERPGRLPLLQHVLRELWLRRDLETRQLRYAHYQTTGGLEAAIATAADTALEQLRREHGDAVETTVRRVMTRLVHLGEIAHADTRRRATRDELGTDALTTEVLTVFVGEARVLVASELAGVEVFEFAHEALLREWDKLIAWLDADREALRLRQELATAAEHHAAHLDAEYLWGRGRVDEAERILAQSTLELVEDERSFLALSQQRARTRERLTWTAIASVLLVLLGFSGFTLYLALENRQQAGLNQALAASERAERDRANASASAQKGLRASMLAVGRMDLEPLLLAIEALSAHGPPFERPPPPDTYRGVLDALAMPEIAGPLATLTGHSRSVSALGFSADGQQLASASLDGSVRLWDAGSGDPLRHLEGHDSGVTALAFSPDGSRLATASWDDSVRLWDLDSGRPLARLEGHLGDVLALAFSPDGSRLATASSDTSARVWDVDSGRTLTRFEGHAGNVSAVAFSPDGSRLATASHDTTARIWDPNTGALLFTLAGHESRLLDLRFSPDGSRLVTCGFEPVARAWDVHSGEALARFEGHESSIVEIEISPDGSKLATASFDDTARVWELDSGRELTVLEGHTDEVLSLAFWADGTRLITGSADATVRLWALDSGRELAVLEGHTDDVLAVAATPDDARFASSSADSGVRLWQRERPRPSPSLDAHIGAISALHYAPDGSRLTSAGDDGSVRSWHPHSHERQLTLDAHAGHLTTAVYSPDGSQLATAGHDATVRLWDATTGRALAVFEGHTSYVVDLAFSPDGSQLASASYDATARIWGTQSHKLLDVFEGHTSRVVDLVFSPDGSRLATASYDTSVRVWDVHLGDQLALLDGHGDYVVDLAFSPDGSTLASASWDHTARLWDVRSGRQRALLQGHDDHLLALAFSPDGAQLVTASADKSVRAWASDSGVELHRFAGHADEVLALRFSPDGTRFATASADDAVRLWDPGTGDLLAIMLGHTDDVSQLVFSPDGRYLASAGSDGSIRTWPMPAVALRLACDRIAPYLDRTRVAAICAHSRRPEPTL